MQLCDWEVYVQETAQQILQEQTPKRLLEVRTRLYELLTHCIPPEVIIKVRCFRFAVSITGLCGANAQSLLPVSASVGCSV